MCHTIYGKFNLLIHMDYSYLWEADIDRICIGRPIKKAQKNNSSIFYPRVGAGSGLAIIQ